MRRNRKPYLRRQNDKKDVYIEHWGFNSDNRDYYKSKKYKIAKYKELKARINQSNVSEIEKKFLLCAAKRHVVFNYSKIADYYASASPEMQKLMEDSALVIIDFNDAIAKGYVKLNKRIADILAQRTKNNEE